MSNLEEFFAKKDKKKGTKKYTTAQDIVRHLEKVRQAEEVHRAEQALVLATMEEEKLKASNKEPKRSSAELNLNSLRLSSGSIEDVSESSSEGATSSKAGMGSPKPKEWKKISKFSCTKLYLQSDHYAKQMDPTLAGSSSIPNIHSRKSFPALTEDETAALSITDVSASLPSDEKFLEEEELQEDDQEKQEDLPKLEDEEPSAPLVSDSANTDAGNEKKVEE